MNLNRRLLCIGFLSIACLNLSAAEECPKENDFMCRSDKRCIDSALMCNKENDCADHSDEENCECLEPEWYLCKDNTTCVSHSARCDGHFDCPTEDDEDHCDHYVPHHEITKCTKNEFKCNSDNVCLPLELVCDGTKHCFDGTDETIGCETIKTTCNGFTCNNGHCLTDSAWVCDGYNDCVDNSDEQNCTYDCTVQNNKYLCSDNVTCIPMDKVCNNVNDCSNGDDEGRECKNKDCSLKCQPNGKCVNLPSGPTCACPKGFEYDEDKKLCEDINECAKYGVCSQGCVNTLGSYKCTCAPKFRLSKSNNRTCRAIGKVDALLIYAASKSVNWFTLRTKHLKRVAESLNQVVGISYDGEHIYWTDISVQVESIMRAKTDGSEIETLFTAGLSKPEDVAIDYITGNLYFSDNDYQHIAVCSNDGRYCKAIITENVHRPRGIALHPQKGKMYWTDWGTKPMIGVASMDGTSVQPLITDDIHWPNGLTLDWPNDRIYWVDAKTKSIDSSKLDGTDRRSIIAKVSKHPYGIAVFENKLYWSDWDSKSIQSCDKFTCKNRTTIIRDTVIYDVHIYHPAMQSFARNPCLDEPCSHLCLLNMNNSYTCDCPKNMELTVDKHHCRSTSKQKIILLGIGNRLVSFEHQSFGRHENGEGKTLPFKIDKMAYNSINGDLIVADNLRRAIIQVNLEKYTTKDLITDNIGNITAMSFDELANNLYWADAERSTIEVYSFNTQHRAIVQHFMAAETPIALAAIPQNGKLFVALRSSSHTHLDMFASDGRGAHFHLLEDELGNGPISMLVDHELEEVFWTDYEQAKISYTDFSGQSHHTFLYDVDNPVSMATIGEDLFWSTSKSLKLSWTPKHSFVGTKSMNIEHPFESPHPMNMELIAMKPLTVSKHVCAQLGHYGGCSHVCVAMGRTSHACLCAPGTVFHDTSNTTCIPAEDCYFRCGSGECITELQRCDGRKDCQDASDETECQHRKEYVTCGADEFTCLDRLKCIDRKSRCDSTFDCADESDEKDCKDYNKETKCHQNQFLCLDGSCIDSNSLCDGFKDCPSGEDELSLNCQQSSSRTCNAEEFKCSNGQCIPTAWVCDGSLDCANDEENCAPEACGVNEKQCDHGTCISKSLWCNGDNDCGDFSDETNCHIAEQEESIEITCGDGKSKMFQCKSNKTICLDMTKRCNGKAECPKGEDELDCDQCAEDEFKCDAFECISKRWRCDNQIDCRNGKDEENCVNVTDSVSNGTHYHPACSETEFKCKNEQCVDWDRVCNGKHDGCTDESDEGGNCDISCRDSPCQQRCIRSPNGPVCSCLDGYSLNPDKKTCRDIDECSNNQIPCSQKCDNLIGAYRCSCFSGFALSSDKITCKSLDDRMFMFYSAFDTIYQKGSHLAEVKSTNSSKILGLDMHFDKKLLYFTIEDSETLYEFNWTDSSGGMNLVKNIGSPTQVAVDWITENVYFIDKLTAIKVCHMENRKCITLIELKEGEHIKSLAVDAFNHRLFYATVKKFEFTMPESKIFAHNLDGSQQKLVTTDSFFVPALTCDYYTERVYYVGLETKTIWSVKYDGTGKQLMIAKSEFITRPIEINLFESHAYVSNSGSKIVAKCQLYGDRQCNGFPLNVNQPDNLVIAQKSRQKSGENACANNKCSTICTPSHRGAKCICDFGHMVEAGVECNSVREQRNQPIFHQHEAAQADTSGSTAKTVFGTLAIIILLIVVVMGGLFIFKRFYAKPNSTIRMHFENPRTAMEAARVKMSKLNEIMISRQNNNNNNNSNSHNESIPSTMIEEQEFTELTNSTVDDTRKLLL